MARDLKLNVDGNSGGAQRALEEAALAADAAARAANHLGDEFNKAKRDAAGLDRQLLETAVAAKALAKELAKNPADAALKKQLAATKKTAGELKTIRADIIGDTERAAKDAAKVADATAKEFGKATASAAKDAEKLAGAAKKEFDSLVKDVTQSGSSLGDLFGGGPLGFLTSGPGAVVGAGLAVGAGAAAGGATAALAGAGVAGVGIAGAAMGDPAAFSAAWSGVTSKLKTQFLDATKVFDGPGLDAVHSIGDAIGKWDLKGLFAAAVPYVAPLVAGTEAAAGYIIAGVKALVQDAGPAVAVFAKDLPDIGKSIGTALAAIGSQAEGGAQGLHAVLVAIEDSILALGYFVAGTEGVVGGIATMTHAAQDFFNNIPLWVKIALPNLALLQGIFNLAPGRDDGANASRLGNALAGLASSQNSTSAAAARHAAELAKLDEQMGLTTVKATSLSQGVDQIFQSLLAADHAALSWDESLTNLSSTIKSNGRTIDEHTAKGQANREAILSSIAANAQLYVSNIDSGKGVAFATDAYDKNEKALEKTARQAGLSQAQIDQLVGKYKSVPDTVKTDVQMKGLTDAINGLDDVLRRINHLPPRRTVEINVALTGNLRAAESLLGAGIVGGAAPKHNPKFNARGAIRHAATGLIVGPSDPGTIIGEPQTGGEALIPLQGIAPTRAASLAQTALRGYGYDVTPRARIPGGLFSGGGGSGGTTSVTVNFAGANRPAEQMLATVMAQMLRTGQMQLIVNNGRVKAA